MTGAGKWNGQNRGWERSQIEISDPCHPCQQESSGGRRVDAGLDRTSAGMRSGTEPAMTVRRRTVPSDLPSRRFVQHAAAALADVQVTARGRKSVRPLRIGGAAPIGNTARAVRTQWSEGAVRPYRAAPLGDGLGSRQKEARCLDELGRRMGRGLFAISALCFCYGPSVSGFFLGGHVRIGATIPTTTPRCLESWFCRPVLGWPRRNGRVQVRCPTPQICQLKSAAPVAFIGSSRAKWSPLHAPPTR